MGVQFSLIIFLIQQLKRGYFHLPLFIHQIKVDMTMSYTYNIKKGIVKSINNVSKDETNYMVETLKDNDLVLSVIGTNDQGVEDVTLFFTFKKE